jgi:hypothetical protein
MTRTLVREALVLLVGVAVSGAAAIILERVGRDLEFVHGIVIPIAFCLVRAAFVSGCAQETTWGRRLAYQVFIAGALIALLLFEMGVGLFAGARDIPMTVWMVVAGFGGVYCVMICVAERWLEPSDLTGR